MEAESLVLEGGRDEEDGEHLNTEHKTPITK